MSTHGAQQSDNDNDFFFRPHTYVPFSSLRIILCTIPLWWWEHEWWDDGMHNDVISSKLLYRFKNISFFCQINFQWDEPASFATLVSIISPCSRTSDNNHESLITKLSKWVDTNNRRRMPSTMKDTACAAKAMKKQHILLRCYFKHHCNITEEKL